MLFFSGYTIADAPLDKKLGLDDELSRKVKEIQKLYRLEFSSKRQQLHQEQRTKFEEVLKQRKAAYGSSRDVKEF